MSILNAFRDTVFWWIGAATVIIAVWESAKALWRNAMKKAPEAEEQKGEEAKAPPYDWASEGGSDTANNAKKA